MIEYVGTDMRVGGHYSPAVRVGGTVYISGQLPVKPGGDHSLAAAPFRAQADAAFANLAAVLAAAGLSAANVVKLNAYLADIGDWEAFNTIHAAFFGDHRPARTVVPTPKLHYGYALEIDAVAVS